MSVWLCLRDSTKTGNNYADPVFRDKSLNVKAYCDVMEIERAGMLMNLDSYTNL